MRPGDSVSQPPRCSSCFGCRQLGEWVRFFCEPGEEQELTGHALLARLHEQRAQEQQAAETRAAELRLAEEQAAQEWQAELVRLEQRRANLEGEELQKDCLSYFAAAEWLQRRDESESPATPATRDTTAPTAEAATAEEEPEDAEASSSLAAVVAEAFEEWLQSKGRWGSSSSGSQLAASLVETLRRCAELAEEEIATQEEQDPHESSLGEQLDKLLEQFESPSAASGARPETSEDEALESALAPDSHRMHALACHAERCRDVGNQVVPLLPCLEGDLASAQLVVALATLDIGSGLISNSPEVRHKLQSPLRALSTVDVCWGLCSEKQALIVQHMLPSTQSSGAWCWAELRRSGVAWWLGGCNNLAKAELDSIVKKLAQASLNKLKQPSTTWDANRSSELFSIWGCAPSEDACVARRLAIDEAVFWSVVMGAKIPKLRVLAHTGLLREPDPPNSTGTQGRAGGIEALLQHERVAQPDFLRKNAFRLLQLHRYHLAATLFLLCDCFDEAARVLAGHLRDLQLVLVVTRSCREIARPLLLDRLAEMSPDSDPWLSFMLAWHAGDRDRARSCLVAARNTTRRPRGGTDAIFDGALQTCSRYSEGLCEAAEELIKSC